MFSVLSFCVISYFQDVGIGAVLLGWMDAALAKT